MHKFWNHTIIKAAERQTIRPCSTFRTISLRSIPLISPEHVAGGIVALYPHGRYLSAKVRTFIDTLVDRFAEERPVV